MTRLTTTVGSFSLLNPVICGSGEPVMTEAGIVAALRAGAGGVIAKSVNENPAGGQQLDRADYVQLDAHGTPTAGQGVSLFNRSGLSQRAAGDWFAAIAAIDAEARHDGQFVAASIVYAGADGAVSIAAQARTAGLRVFELNVGAPHASEAAPGAIVQETDPDRLAELVRRVRAVTEGMQLWVKLTGLSSNLPALALAARHGGADAVCMMGRFMGLLPDMNTFAPVLGTSAAYGGGWALPIVCRFLALTRKAAGTEFPLMGTNGVRSGEDVLRMALCGASAVEVLSVTMHEGFGAISRMILELNAFLTERDMTFRDLIGRTADGLAGYGEQPEIPRPLARVRPAGDPDRTGYLPVTPSEHLSALWTEAELPADALDDVTLTGTDPVLPSSFAVGTAAQVTIAASALAAATVWRHRGLRRQSVSVDMRHAAVEFLSEHFAVVEGTAPEDPWDRIAGTYQCGDGRWVRLHTNFPHHRAGILRILDCEYDRQAVAAALQSWTGFALEDAAAENNLCATAMRSFAEWDIHPHGKAVVTQPVVKITRIGDAPPRDLPPAGRPLSGVRVLDLTRVIAGPVCGRTLAAHGADVMNVSSPNIPNFARLAIDTGRGKLSTYLELRDQADNDRLKALLSQADIFVQGYRPGGLADLGFSPQEAATIRPGIVYVSLSAYGHVGPWSGRRGFDSITQTATGLNHAEAEAAGQTAPKALPCQALDHGSGYLLAFGALTALMRRMQEGGSWHVQVSLARTGRWIRDLGRVQNGLAIPAPTAAGVADLMEESPCAAGRLHAVRHAAELSETKARWDRPSAALGTHEAAWP